MSEEFDFLGSAPTPTSSGEHFETVEETTEVVEGDVFDHTHEDGEHVTVHEEIIHESPKEAFTSQQEQLIVPPPPLDFGGELSAVRKYQIAHDELLQEKAAKSEEKRRQTIAKAQADIANFYKERALNREKTDANNRTIEQQFQANLEATLANSQSWESVGNLVDLQAKPLGKDTTRMRQVLVQLKH